MGAYSPLKITGMKGGLVQSREEFILPDDAYPTLENAYVWRERIRRKDGYLLLGRLQRTLTTASIGNISAAGAGPVTVNIFTQLNAAGLINGAKEVNAELIPGTSTTPIVVNIGAPINEVLTDSTGTGTMTAAPGVTITSATINYATGDLVMTFALAAGASAATITTDYAPGLPVMGLRNRELNNINNEQLVAFDRIYSYINNGTKWIEFIPTVSIPGTNRWTGTDSDFFWSTNYWVGDGNLKIFWVTNFSGVSGDLIRYTNAVDWVNFTPQIDTSGNLLNQCLALLPYRGRLVAFNTFEGLTLGASTNFRQRIRWSAIGTPFTTASSVVTTNLNVNAWRDDIRGQGGFLDIPTSEDIVSVGFVRDNIVVYCERSTWQLRYTGRTIAPFQMERVNSELGAESTFSAVQFDTSLVGIGDKGVVECDSYKSERIDIKIPDLVFEFRNTNQGTKRVHGIRDFQQRLAYWTYVYNPDDESENVYPNRRLVYNYENDSWAIFTDSLTTLGTYQKQIDTTWAACVFPWSQANFPWLNIPALFPSIVGGNQQGFVEYLGGNLQPKVSNDISLSITGITGNTTTSTLITCPNHNLETGQVVKISNIPTGTPFATSLNGNIFGIIRNDANSFFLWIYSTATGQFSTPQLNPSGTYIGGGKVAIRDGFSIISKKFNYLDEGQNIQVGYVDVLTEATSSGAITLNMYLNYNNNAPVNVKPENEDPNTTKPDLFFNSTVPTSASSLNGIAGSKYWQRVFCPVRGNFVTVQWTLSNAQLVGIEQESYVQIDAQILWRRKAGRLTNI